MYLFLAILMLSCAQFGSQIFLPALPAIAAHFAIANSDAQQIMMLYFVAFGLSQLIFGPWSDSAGRRRVFLWGQLLYVIGSVLSAMASSPWMLAVGRICQGLGAGAPLIVSRTLLSDTLAGDRQHRAFASLAVAASVISVLTPMLGGWITLTGSWRSLFVIVACYLVLVWLIGWRLLPRRQGRRQAVRVPDILRQYGGLLRDGRFITAASFKWLPTLLFLTCVTYFPFEFQQRLSMSAQDYGFYMTVSTTGLILGTLLAKVALRYFNYRQILALCWPLLLISGLGFCLLPPTLTGILVSYGCFMICGGAFYPCCLQLMVAPFPDRIGTVNALSGAIDMFVISLVASVFIEFWLTDLQSLGLMFLGVSLLLAISWWLMGRWHHSAVTQDGMPVGTLDSRIQPDQ